MSIAGGLERAVSRGVAVGCEVIQIFIRNQVQWRFPPLPDETVALFRQALHNAPIRGAVAHASYLFNLASPDPDQRRRSIRQLAEEYRRAQQLGLIGVIFHAGSTRGAPRKTGLRRIIQGIRTVLERVAPEDDQCRLLVENAAGQGDTLPMTLEEWYDVVMEVGDKHVGWCLDTCHLFAAGYAIDTEEGYERLMEFLTQGKMLNRLPVVHINDSKRPRGSRVDRHEHIGEGHIGRWFFQRLMTDARWERTWMILETPKDREGEWDRRNLALLKRFRAVDPDVSPEAREEAAESTK